MAQTKNSEAHATSRALDDGARPGGLSSREQLKRSLAGLSYDEQVQMLRPDAGLQFQGSPDSSKKVHELAAQGTSGSAGALPHQEAIQKSFGRHDVSDVKAHVGGKAAEANRAMGAEAFARGNSVAFRKSPSLHTAAHEAAHVVQQRAGVSLPSGVGRSGDTFERHADAVANAVTKGESAEALLDRTPGGHGSTAVQHRRQASDAGTTDEEHAIRRYAGYLQRRSIPHSTKIARKVYEGLNNNDPSKYDEAAAMVPMPPIRGLCLWSGYGCKALAESTGVELNTTAVGKLAADFKFVGRAYSELFPLWCAVSKRFAESARGEVNIFIGFSEYNNAGGIRPDSVFGSTEKQALEDLAAANPAYRIVPKYHSIAAVHDIPTGNITGAQENLPVTTNPDNVPAPKALYWWTGKPADATNTSQVYVKPHTRGASDVAGHIRRK